MMSKKIPLNIKNDLLILIDKQEWTFAKTYAKIAPHEYFVDKSNIELFDKLNKFIDEYGVDEMFELSDTKHEYRYLNLEKYRYWKCDNILNRTEVKNIAYNNGVSYHKLR